MDICFEGVGQVAATFKVDGESVEPGMAVTLTDYGMVGLGNDGDVPCGVLLGGVRGGAAAVQIGGVAKVSFSGTAPAAGWQELVCDGKGGIKTTAETVVETVVESDTETDAEIDAETVADTAAGGLKCLVLAVDKGDSTVVIKL